MKKITLFSIIIMLYLFMISCTIYYTGTTTTIGGSTGSTTTTNPSGNDADLASCVITNLSIAVDKDSATLTWNNPTLSSYSGSELYLYELSDNTEDGDEYALSNSYLISRSSTSYLLRDLKPQTKYMVQIVCSTTSGATDFVNKEFTSGAVIKQTVNMSSGMPSLSGPARFSIDYNTLYSYRSKYFDDEDTGYLLQTGESGQVEAYDLPAGVTINDLKWYVYWLWYDTSGQGLPDVAGDQYSEDPCMLFEEGTQRFYAKRRCFGFIIGYINDYQYSNILYFDIRDRIDRIRFITPAESAATKTLFVDETKGIHSTVLRSYYFDADNTLIPAPGIQTLEWSVGDSSVVSIEPRSVYRENGKPFDSTHECVITAVGPGKTTVTLTVNGISSSVEYTVISVSDQSDDPSNPAPTPVTVNTVTFDNASMALKVGQEATADYTVEPAEAANLVTLYAYKAANGTEISDVVEVQDNRITAIKSGTAYLKAVWYEGTTRHESSAVTITAVTPLTDFILNTNNVSLQPTETFSLSYTKIPSFADDFTAFTYTSSAESVATVNGSGIITAVGDGTAEITVATTSNGNTFSKKVAVSVYTPVETQTPITVSSVTFSNTADIKMAVGQNIMIPAYTVNPPEAESLVTIQSFTDANGTEESYNLEINNNTIKAQSAGTAYLKAVWEDGKSSQSVKVTTYTALQDFTLNTYNVSLEPSETFSLTAAPMPSNADDCITTYSSGKTSVATVNANGVISAKADGTANITVKMTANGKTVTKTVSVTVTTPVPELPPMKVAGVKFNEVSQKIYVGNEIPLPSYIVEPPEASSLVSLYIYSSANGTDESTVAEIRNKKILGLKSGTAYLKAVWYDGTTQYTSYPVTINVKVALESLNLNTSSVQLSPNDTFQLSATPVPSNADDYGTITYTSGNTSIATVSSSGLITGIAAGSTTVTAQTTNGINKIVSVKVCTPVTSLSLSDEFVIVGTQTPASITATVGPSNATDKTVTWKSENTQVVTISSRGKITFRSQGVAWVKASAGQLSKRVLVVSINDVGNLIVPQSQLTKTVTGMTNQLQYTTTNGGSTAFNYYDVAAICENQWQSPFKDGINWIINNKPVTLPTGGSGKASVSITDSQTITVWIKPIMMGKEQIVFVQAIPRIDNQIKVGAYAQLVPSVPSKFQSNPAAFNKGAMVNEMLTAFGLQTTEIDKKEGGMVTDMSLLLNCFNTTSYPYISSVNTIYIGNADRIMDLVYNNISDSEATYTGNPAGMSFSYTIPALTKGKINPNCINGSDKAEYDVKFVGIHYIPNAYAGVEAIVY